VFVLSLIDVVVYAVAVRVRAWRYAARPFFILCVIKAVALIINE